MEEEFESFYNSDLDEKDFGNIELKLNVTEFKAKPRKLNVTWTRFAEEDFEKYYNIDAEDLLLKGLAFAYKRQKKARRISRLEIE